MGTLNDAKMPSLNDKIAEKAAEQAEVTAKAKKVKTKKVELGKSENKQKGKK